MTTEIPVPNRFRAFSLSMELLALYMIIIRNRRHLEYAFNASKASSNREIPLSIKGKRNRKRCRQDKARQNDIPKPKTNKRQEERHVPHIPSWIKASKERKRTGMLRRQIIVLLAPSGAGKRHFDGRLMARVPLRIPSPPPAQTPVPAQEEGVH